MNCFMLLATLFFFYPYETIKLASQSISDAEDALSMDLQAADANIGSSDTEGYYIDASAEEELNADLQSVEEQVTEQSAEEQVTEVTSNDNHLQEIASNSSGNNNAATQWASIGGATGGGATLLLAGIEAIRNKQTAQSNQGLAEIRARLSSDSLEKPTHLPQEIDEAADADHDAKPRRPRPRAEIQAPNPTKIPDREEFARPQDSKRLQLLRRLKR